MKKTNKKGFTIVELVIVIAVIAILAAVLIPTFASITKKARRSADQQAVHQMNTAIATFDKEDIKTIADLKALLKAENIDADRYKPLTKDTQFFWNGEVILQVNKDNEVIYPEKYKGNTQGDETWISLSGEGNKVLADKVIATETAGKLEGVLDLQGASVNIVPSNGFVLGAEAGKASAEIKNVVSDEGSKVASNTGEFADNVYFAGLIQKVKAGTTVTVQNLIIDGATIGDTTMNIDETARAGIICGHVEGKLIIKNVTIKNSTVFAGYRVGALVGSVAAGGSVEIENVTFENVTVKGASNVAKLIGDVKETSKVKIGTGITGTDSITVVDINNVPASSIDAQGRVQLPNGSVYAHVTQQYFWVQHGYTWNDAAHTNWTSNDEAMSTSWNV